MFKTASTLLSTTITLFVKMKGLPVLFPLLIKQYVQNLNNGQGHELVAVFRYLTLEN